MSGKSPVSGSNNNIVLLWPDNGWAVECLFSQFTFPPSWALAPYLIEWTENDIAPYLMEWIEQLKEKE